MSTPQSGKRKRKASNGEAVRNEDNLVKQACVACRQRKIRCNAEKPRCFYCLSKEQDCIYGEPFRRAQCAQSHVDALETKIKQLEHENSLSHNPLIHSNSAAPPQPWSPALVSSAAPSDTPNHPTTAPPSTSLPGQLPKRYGKSSTLHFALAVKASATAIVEHREPLANGDQDPPASYPLINDPQARDRSSLFDETEDVYEYEDEGPSSKVRRYQEMSQLLPHRQLAKYLFDRYFEAVHPIWPLLLEFETRDLFARMWTSDEPIEPIWLVQLNLIMGLGCQYCTVADRDRLPSSFDPQTFGEDLYSRAQDYVLANAFTESSIGMLQALLLTIQFLQITMQINELYLLVGHASRMAQHLGFHVSRPELESISPQQQELRRRLWWGCFCFDRISSMLYGRPMGIPYGIFSDYQDKLPQQVDDDHIARHQDQPADTPSMNAFFRHSVRLYHVMGDVFLRLRNAKTTAYQELKTASSDVRINRPVSNVNAMLSLLSTITELDGHLLSWHEYLPTFLQFPLDNIAVSTQPTQPWISHQFNTLRSRFLGMRMMLHRQTLLFLLQSPERRNWPQNGIQEWPPLFSDRYNDTLVGGSTPFRRQGLPSQVEVTLTHLSARICVSCALLQIEATDTQASCTFDGESWWNLNATFNALCVLCGATALHRQDLDAVVPDLPRAHDTIQKGLKIMHSLAATGATKAQQSERFVQRLMPATLRRVEKVRDRSAASDPTTQVCGTDLKLQTSITSLTSKENGTLTNNVAFQDKCKSNRALSPDAVLATSFSAEEAFDAPSNPTHSTPQQHPHLASHQMSGATNDQRLHLSHQSSISRHSHMQNFALDDSSVPTAMGSGPSSTQGHPCNAGGIEVATDVENHFEHGRGDATFHEIGGTALVSDQTFYNLPESSDDSIQMLFDNSFDMWTTLWDGVEG